MSFVDILYLMGLPWLGFKAATDSRYRHRLRERFGAIPEADPALWIHASSVGEVNLVKLIARRIEQPLRVTAFTRAGLENAEKNFPLTSYLPLDFTPFVRKAFRRARPTGIVLVELEVWPNFLSEAAQAGIPVVVVNGRIRERSARRYARLPSVFGPAFRAIRAAGVQDEAAAERLRRLGVRHVVVTGNLKYDVPVPFDPDAVGREWREKLGWGDAPVLFGGSTHDPEESFLLDAYSALRENYPSLKLVLAPRHLERIPEVQKSIEARGLPCYKRSEIQGRSGGTLILDTLGELAQLYSIATIVFIGGTFGPRGGQNMLEPAALAKPVLSGPNVSNFRGIAEELAAAGGMKMLSAPADLRPAIEAWLRDPPKARICGERGREIAQKSRGALDKTVNLIREHINGGS